MKSIFLHICDRDKVYLDRLNGFIQQQEHSPFLVRTYTEFDKALKDVTEKTILLISSRMLILGEDEMKLQDALAAWKHVVILDENGETPWDGAYSVIEKYQSAREVFNGLVNLCMEDTLLSRGNYAGLKADRCITGIYTPEDKGLLHRFSQDYAKGEAVKGKCLLISFEECVPENKEMASMSDVICLIKEKESDVTSKIENYVIKEDGLDKILPPSCPYDLYEVSDGEWSDFILELAKKQSYTQIIIDFGNQLPGVELLKMCSKILLPCTMETKRKCERFKELLIFMGKDLICKKTEIVMIKGEQPWNMMN